MSEQDTEGPNVTENQKSGLQDASSHSFANVVDIACAARYAFEQAELAHDYAASIVELSRIASQRVTEVQNLANSLVATASSATSVFMHGSPYVGLKEAFDSRPEFQRRIDYPTFKHIVTNQVEFAQEDYNLWRKETRETKDDTQKINRSQQKDRPPVHTEEQAPSMKSLKTSDKRKLSLDSALVQGSPTVVKERSWSMIVDSDDLGKEKYSKEKFPSSRSVMEYKDNLANSFDSKCAITTLWEDRYVHDSKSKDAKSTPLTSTPETWIEKKALKQFQMKLHPFKSPSLEEQLERDAKCQEYVKKGLDHIKKGQLRPLHGRVAKLSDDDTESDLSTDSEIDSILREPRPIRKLKHMTEHRIPCMAGEENEANRLPAQRAAIIKDRSLSPLLNDTEKENYTVHVEEPNISSSNTAKQYFTLTGSSPGPSSDNKKQK